MRSFLLVVSLVCGAHTAANAQESGDAGPDLDTIEEQPERQGDELPSEATGEAQPTTLVVVTLRLNNGVSMRGTMPTEALLYWTSGADVKLTLEEGNTVTIPGATIASIQAGSATPSEMPAQRVEKPPEVATANDDGEFSYPNAAATRYLYAPSAIPMQKGQGYISQKLVITSVAYALTDNMSFVLGTFPFFPPALTIAGLKTAFPVGENVHIGFGGETFLTNALESGTESLASVVFGNVTFGDLDSHVTFASGYMNFDGQDNIPVVIAGHHRINDRIGFVTENWLLVDMGNPFERVRTRETSTVSEGVRTTTRVTTIKSLMSNVGPLAGIVSGSVRFIGKRDWQTQLALSNQTADGYPKSTVDVGLIGFIYREQPNKSDYELIFPMPWVDWSWHFGPARR